MQVSATIEVTLPGLERYQKSIRAQLAGSADGRINKVFLQWAVRYRSFIQRRFNTYSRGGGDWAPLKDSTILKRRKPAKGKSGGARVASILRDTGSLFNALAPSMSAPEGSINERTPMGIKVGYGGGSRHPEAGVTIAELAYWHQVGAGNYPARPIIVDPDADTIKGMVADMQRACNEESS